MEKKNYKSLLTAAAAVLVVCLLWLFAFRPARQMETAAAQDTAIAPETAAASETAAETTAAETTTAESTTAETAAGPAFAYEHDPRDNPNAMKDIVENPAAVYGFSPSPDSVRLKQFVDIIDWTDPAQVAEKREERIAYHESMSELYRMIEDMLHEAKPVEEIARAVSKRRNELRLEAYKDDPEGLALVKKSNLETYGDEMGPTPDSLYEKYGSWQTVLEKALSSNPGVDACLGLYDEYYYIYDIETEAEKEDKQ